MSKFRLMVTLLASAVSCHTLAATDPTEIMRQVDQRYMGDTQIAQSVLTLIDNKDRQRTRDLKMFRLENSAVEKSVIFFLSPADVKGTAYMSFDWTDTTKEDDAWLYLPALQQVKRVAASDESGAFMGSDFSYTDINGIEFEDFTYSLIKENDQVQGHDCWLIESLPKDDSIIKKTGYTSAQSWVRKDNFMVVQSKIEVQKSKKTKYFSATDIVQIDGIWTAKTLQMVTTRNGKKEHASQIQFGEILYNQQVDESLFDTQVLQRGI